MKPDIMDLRLKFEALIMHAGDCERQLALERERIAHLESEMIAWAARAGTAEAKIDTARDVEREAIIADLMREILLVNTHGLLLSTERLEEIIKSWRTGAHWGKR